MTQQGEEADQSAWLKIRQRYEARDESVAAIAASLGMTGPALIAAAKARGWAMRTTARPKLEPKPKPKPARRSRPKAQPAAKPPEALAARPIRSTQEAISRLKDLVQARIARLEQHQEPAHGARGITAANLLARTLEKVLELEEQQRRQTRLNAQAGKRRDDAWREELAGRIARLIPGGAGAGISPGPEPGGAAGPAGGLAPVGA